MVCKNFMLQNCNLHNCTNFETCVASSDDRPLVKCSENKKEYTLQNDCKLLVQNFHMDSGVIKDSNCKKCDYLMHIPSKDKIILIELKGSSYARAVEQILSTIELCISQFQNKHIYARIVSQGVPNIQNDTTSVKLKKYLFMTNGNLISHTNCLIEKESKM